MERNEMAVKGMNGNKSFGREFVNESFHTGNPAGTRSSGNIPSAAGSFKTFTKGKADFRKSGSRKSKVPPVPAHVKLLDKAYAEKMPEKPTICIHSCVDENGERTGAYTAVILDEKGSYVAAISGGQVRTTMNRMYLMGLMEALKVIEKVGGAKTVCIDTDEDYVKSGVRYRWFRRWDENGWKTTKGSSVKNIDLWRAVSDLFGKDTFRYFVPNHGRMGKDFINRCDIYARAAMPRIMSSRENWEAM